MNTPSSGDHDPFAEPRLDVPAPGPDLDHEQVCAREDGLAPFGSVPDQLAVGGDRPVVDDGDAPSGKVVDLRLHAKIPGSRKPCQNPSFSGIHPARFHFQADRRSDRTQDGFRHPSRSPSLGPRDPGGSDTAGGTKGAPLQTPPVGPIGPTGVPCHRIAKVSLSVAQQDKVGSDGKRVPGCRFGAGDGRASVPGPQTLAVGRNHQQSPGRKESGRIQATDGPSTADRPARKDLSAPGSGREFDPFRFAIRRIRCDLRHDGALRPQPSDKRSTKRETSHGKHGRHYRLFLFCALLLLLGATGSFASFDEQVPFDSLPDAASSTENDSLEWDDSLARASSARGKLSWASSVRGGSCRSVANLEHASEEGFSLSLRHSDPGGLKRRKLSYNSEAISLRAGDLSPWSDLRLLEGASSRKGWKGDTTLVDRLMFGSGSTINGLEAEASGVDAAARARLVYGKTRSGEMAGSGSASVRWRSATIGLRYVLPDSAGADAGCVAAIGVGGPNSHLEVAIADPSRSRSSVSMLGRIAADAGDVRMSLAGRHVPAGFRHEGLPSGWNGTSAATASLSRRIDQGSRVGFVLDALRDSTGRVGARGLAEVEAGIPEVRLRSRAGWSENSPKAPRWNARSVATFESGSLSPSIGVAISDSAGRNSTRGEAGARFRHGSQIVTGTVSYSPTAGSDWRISQSSETTAGSLRLALDLSATGALRGAGALGASGSVAVGW